MRFVSICFLAIPAPFQKTLFSRLCTHVQAMFYRCKHYFRANAVSHIRKYDKNIISFLEKVGRKVKCSSLNLQLRFFKEQLVVHHLFVSSKILTITLVHEMLVESE